MLDKDRSCYVSLVHVSSLYDMIGQFRSQCDKFAHVRDIIQS